MGNMETITYGLAFVVFGIGKKDTNVLNLIYQFLNRLLQKMRTHSVG